MTKQHFQAMADIVRAILAGEWTNEHPAWSLETHSDISWYGRAVQTAEAFIVLCERWNPRFDRACNAE